MEGGLQSTEHLALSSGLEEEVLEWGWGGDEEGQILAFTLLTWLTAGLSYFLPEWRHSAALCSGSLGLTLEGWPELPAPPSVSPCPLILQPPYPTRSKEPTPGVLQKGRGGQEAW